MNKKGYHTYRDMIIEMLLFPDQTSRLAIEPLLESAGLELTEELEITGFLQLHAETRIHYPQEAVPIVLKIPPEQVELYCEGILHIISKVVDTFLEKILGKWKCGVRKYQPKNEGCPFSFSFHARRGIGEY